MFKGRKIAANGKDPWTMTPELKNFIAGEWIAPASGEYGESHNPARWSEVIARFPRSGQQDVDRAVAAAR